MLILSVAYLQVWTWTHSIDGTHVTYRLTGIRDGAVRYVMHAEPWPVGCEETGEADAIQFYQAMVTP